MKKVTVECTEVYYIDEDIDDNQAKELIREALLLGGEENKDIHDKYWAHNEGEMIIEVEHV